MATFYGPARPGGACLTLTVPKNLYTAAVDPTHFDNGRACGSYVQVTGAKGSILVKIDNLCPECMPGQLDLSTEAFAAIDAPVKGKVAITYRTILNPAIPDELMLQVKTGSSQWWLGLLVDNTGNALESVEISDRGAEFRPLSRQSWGWTQTNPGTGPFQVRLTDVTGQSVTVSDITLTPDIEQPSPVRLY